MRGSVPARIALYGAGGFGREFYLKQKHRLNIVGWFDRDYEACQKEGWDVRNPATITDHEFDVILITVRKEHVSHEIAKELAKMLPKTTRIYEISSDILLSDYVRQKLKDLRNLEEKQ